ncbi:hypothetical protein IAU60_000289 [Kwoniella sp. DSM 27419]
MTSTASPSVIELTTIQSSGPHGLAPDPSLKGSRRQSLASQEYAVGSTTPRTTDVHGERPLQAQEGDDETILNRTDALPPVDGGYRAWLFLVAATIIEMLVWGLPFSIGVLHLYWTNVLFPGQGASTITLAATLQTGLLYIGCAVVGPLFAAKPRWTRQLQMLGLVCGCASMIAAGFVTKPWHLLITVGIFYPVACALYFPCATLMFEWFHAKRGLAFGILYAGTGVGGSIFPFVMQGLLNRFGYKAAMVSMGIGYGFLGLAALFAIRRRVPLSRYDHAGAERRRATMDWSFYKRREFFLGTITILMTSLGNFIPSLWIPSYAEEIGLHKPNGTALIAIMNAASVVGTAGLGWLSDRSSLRTTVLISCVGSASACAFLWGFGTSSGVLVTFALAFGMLGMSFTALWSKMIGYAAKDDPSAISLVFSIFAAMRGIGNLSSGPVSEALLKYRLNNAPGAYGVANFGVLLVYSAMTILAGGATGFFFRDK